jgi:limonene 1,2-monooxygenase
MLADRLRQLEYLTHGRLMAGFGPGSLPADAYMQGINTAETRDILDDSMEYLVRLFRGETVTCDTKYCKLQDAMLQLEPYHESGSELFVASQVSPSGARLAGKYGLGMLSIGATSTGGFNSLASNWGIAEEVAKDYGNTVNRDQWRLVGPMHIAETREKAMENVRWGYHRWFDYFRNVAALPLAPDGVDPIQQMIDSGFAVIGTPEDAIEQIHRLLEQSGGFGSFLHLAVNWADWAETKKSYELFARYVIPEVNRMNDSRCASEKFLRDNNEKFKGQMQSAVKDSINKYAASKGDKFIHPDLRDHSSKP